MSPRGKGPAREPLSAERWARLEPFVDVALTLPPAERQGYCQQIAASDPALGADLLRLIDQATGADEILDAAAEERYRLVSGDDCAESRSGDDLVQLLQTSLGMSYRLEREIGGGGMARVFVATESGLGRQVAIKLLSPEMAAGINADRFAREIKLAASLQQANIVPLLSAGTAAGFPYYTMPFVEGRSLRDRLARDGPLPIGDAVSILRDVARALAYAHARGVVHRDIKPGNVLLSGGTAVVTDFGIAKAIAAAHAVDLPDADSTTGDADPIATNTLTQAGASLGTPAYMAPEQAVGDPTSDHRADLYSFGCMAYEIFGGAPPFQHSRADRMIAAHLGETPRSVIERRADIPPAVAGLIARCLEKAPARRPQSATELLQALDSPSAIGRATPRRRYAMMTVIAIATAAIGSAVYLTTHASHEPLTFSIIPFTTSGADSALESRSDGMRDEILTGMAKVPGVQIVGRSAAYRYRSHNASAAPDVRVAERDLGARLVLTGTMRQADGRVILSVQLNDSTTAQELWSDDFVRDLAEATSITNDVVRTVSDTLRSRFGDRVGQLRRAARLGGTTNAAARDEYDIGVHLTKQRGAGVRLSIEHFELAIAHDPNYAEAHAALATALELYPYFEGVAPTEIRDRMIREATLAMRLDSTLAEPHVALAAAYALAAEWDSANVEFERAIALEQPGDAIARVTYARYLIEEGRVAESLAQLEMARRSERTWPVLVAWRAYALSLRGQTDSALAEIKRAIQLGPTLLATTNLGALVSLSAGTKEGNDQARSLMAVPPPPTVMTNAPYVYAKLGDTVTAKRLVQAMESSHPRPWFTDVSRATVRLAVGDSSGALSALEDSERATGPAWVVFIPLPDPAYDLVRQSPRFRSLVRRANLSDGAIVIPVRQRHSSQGTR